MKEFFLKTPHGGFFCGWDKTRHAKTTRFKAVAIKLKKEDAARIAHRLPSYEFTTVPAS